MADDDWRRKCRKDWFQCIECGGRYSQCSCGQWRCRPVLCQCSAERAKWRREDRARRDRWFGFVPNETIEGCR